MNRSQLFIGEDFALCGQISFTEEDSCSSLDEFDLILLLSTTPLGRQITCSTSGKDTLVIDRKPGNGFGVNIPGKLTSSMSEGALTVTSILVHRATGTRTVSEKQTLPIKLPKNRSAVWK